MACACRKVQEKQDRLVELNRRLSIVQNDDERTSLMKEKDKVEAEDTGECKNKFVRFISQFFKLFFIQIPFVLTMTVLVIVVLIVKQIIALIAKTLFNKEIPGVMSLITTYANVKESTTKKLVDTIKEKIEIQRNEPE